MILAKKRRQAELAAKSTANSEKPATPAAKESAEKAPTVESKPVAKKPVESKATETKAPEVKVSEKKIAEPKPAAEKPATSVNVEKEAPAPSAPESTEKTD